MVESIMTSSFNPFAVLHFPFKTLYPILLTNEPVSRLLSKLRLYISAAVHYLRQLWTLIIVLIFMEFLKSFYYICVPLYAGFNLLNKFNYRKIINT